MGAKLSASQREMFLQVVGTLEGGKVKFSKGLLKSFVRWLAFQFPGVSPQHLETRKFWEKVGQRLLALSRQGDTSVDKFFTLFVQIKAIVKEKRGRESKPPQFSPVAPPSPYPRPSPSSLGSEDSGRAARQRPQASPAGGSGRRSPGPSRSPRHPSPGGKAPAVREPSPNPSTHSLISQSSVPGSTPVSTLKPALKNCKTRNPTPKPSPTLSTPRTPKSVRFQVCSPEPQNGFPDSEPQDGAGHVAWPAPSAPGRPSSQNPFFQDLFPPPPVVAPPPNPYANPFLFPPPFPSPSFSPALKRSHWGEVPILTAPPRSPPPLPPRDPLAPPPFMGRSHGSGGSAHSHECCRRSGSSSASGPAYPLPASGSHAPPSGSHGVEPGSDRPGAQNLEPEITLPGGPVIYSRQRGIPNWRPFEYSHKKELCKAQKEFGRKSEYFKGLLEATFSSNILVPSDLKSLFKCLLLSMEYGLWEDTWKRMLGELLPELLQIPDCAVDADQKPMTLDHLCGEGDWSQAEAQAEKIPKPVLSKIQAAAEKAFMRMPTTEPQINYLTMKQGLAEPFIEFVERLKHQAERRVKSPEALEEVLIEVVKANANDMCKHIITSLPLYPEPNLRTMIEACAKKAVITAPLAATRGGGRTTVSSATASNSPSWLVTRSPSMRWLYTILAWYTLIMVVYLCRSSDGWIVPQPKPKPCVKTTYAFLLLAHGHGCEDFEGLCCFNLPSKSSSIHQKINQIKKMVSNIKVESEDWLAKIFKGWGLSEWLASVIKSVRPPLLSPFSPLY
ncbi:uncharacterized protein M8220_001993 [Acridotheres tristis]